MTRLSNHNGGVDLGPIPSATRGALWLTAPGFEGRAEEVPAGGWTETKSFTLGPAAPWKAKVVDTTGEPVPGADVWLTLAPTTDTNGTPTTADGTPLPFFRSQKTGPGGTVSFGHIPASTVLFATKGDTVSSHAIPLDKAPTVLLLEEATTVEVKVEGPLGQGPHVVAVIHENEPDVDRELLRLPIGPNRKTPLTKTPRPTSGALRFQLEGPGLAPSFERIATSDLPSSLSLTLRARPGLLLPVHFEDASGESVEGVRTRLIWQEDGIWMGSSTRVRSDAEGNADLRSPTSPATLWYTHPDFLGGSMDDVLIAEHDQERLTLRLAPFGSVSGVVLEAGRPLPDFSVLYAPSDNVTAAQTLEVHDQEDGRFTIDRAALGRLDLFAVAEGLPQSEPVSVEVVAGKSCEVELLIPPSRPGRGRVVDAVTGDPLPEATIDRYLHGKNGAGIALAGEQHAVDFDGRFQIPGLSAALEQIWVTEPSHAGSVAQSSRGPDHEFDFGVIRLARTSTLTLVFTGTSDFSGYSYQLTGAAEQVTAPIPTNGVVEVSDVLPTNGYVNVQTPQGDWLEVLYSLTSQGPWTRQVVVTSEGQLEIKVDGLDTSNPSDLSLTIEPTSSPEDEERTKLTYAIDGQERHLGGLPLGECVVRLEGPGGPLDSAVVTTTATPKSISLNASSEELAFRLVDEHHSPLAGLQWVLFPSAVSRWIAWGWSDEDGLCRVKGAHANQPYAILITSTDAGHSTSLPVELAAPDRPHDVVFAPTASLDLEVLDGQEPLDGIMLSIRDAETGAFIGWPSTDAEGKLTFGDLTEGDLLISPHSPSIWYEAAAVASSSTTTLTTLQFRRVGSLRVKLLDAYNNPIPGVPLSIKSNDLGADVAEWLAQGRASSPTGLTTNDQGELLLKGLPHGNYTLSSGNETKSIIVQPAKESLAELHQSP